MAYKYDMVHMVTADYHCAEVPAALKGKTFSSFHKAADAICAATNASKTYCVTVRRLEGNRTMGFRAVMPDGDGDYSFQRHWAPEY